MWSHADSIVRKLVVRTGAALAGAVVVVLAGCAVQPGAGAPAPEPVVKAPVPPVAARRPYEVPSPNGTRPDPYYWLRDDSRQSKDVLDYLNAENSYRDAVMAPLAPLRQRIFDELVSRVAPDDSSAPVYDHGYWYSERYAAGQEHPVYVRHKGRRDAPEQVLLDVNALAGGRAFYQVGHTEASPNGKLFAYADDAIGRRQYTLRIKNLETGEMLPDMIPDVEPDFFWSGDGKAIVYIEKDPVTLLSVRVRRHVLGTDAARDELVYEEKDHSYYMNLARSKSEKYLFIALHSTLQSEWLYADAMDPKLHFKPVVPREPNLLYDVDHLGDDFVIRTNWQAPNFRILRAPVKRSGDKRSWRDVVPGRDDAFIQDFAIYKDYLAVNERVGGLLKLRVHPWKAGTSSKQDFVLETGEPSYTMTLIDTPGLTGDGGVQKMRYVYSSLTTPRTTFDYDLKADKNEEIKHEAIPGLFDPANYTSELVQVPARDGTKVPVSVVYRKTTKLDGSAPLFQYGYGSYGNSADPFFRPSWLSLLDRGFVVAVAHVRGGQELGKAWYENGKLLKKKNTFTDFIDVTEYLTAHQYAARDKVFAYGRSAGGLLMGAIANMAPQDYRGIITEVPFVDVVTTMLDESIPLTTNEFNEWGNPKDKPYYDYILSYSPYDNVSAQPYPAMYVATGLWDSQVQYFEPAKWVAKLRATKTDRNPLVFSIDMMAGHGGKPGRFQRYEDTAQQYAFMFWQLGIQP